VKRVTKGGLLLICSLFLLTACGSSGIGKIAGVKSGPNALTGIPGVNGPVLFVKIDDTQPAHPQIGLNRADVVYIEQVEGGLTRLAAVFSNQLPPIIGPIRSARISDIDLMANYGHPAFAYSGAQKLFLPVLKAANIEDLGAEHEPPSIYSRDPSRQDPTNMLLDPQALLTKAIVTEKRTIDNAKSVGWKFGPLPKTGVPVVSVDLKWPASSYQVTWSAPQKRWLLSYRHEPDLGSDGIQLGSPTFIVQNVSITNSIYHDHNGNYTPFSNTVGSGTGYLLRDGQSIPVYWNRATPASATTWTLKDGSPAYFSPGQVWIALTDQKPTFTMPTPTGMATPAPTK